MGIAGKAEALQAALAAFIEREDEVLTWLETTPEAQQPAARVVAALESAQGIDWAFIPAVVPFVDPAQLLAALEQAVHDSFATAASASADAALVPPRALNWHAPWWPELGLEQRFGVWLECVARDLWPHTQGLALVLAFESISSIPLMRDTLSVLAAFLAGAPVRLIVFVDPEPAALEPLTCGATRAVESAHPITQSAEAYDVIGTLLQRPEPRLFGLTCSSLALGLMREALQEREHQSQRKFRCVWVEAPFLQTTYWYDDAEQALREADAHRIHSWDPQPPCQSELGMEAAFASFAEAMAQRWLPKGGSLVVVFVPQPGRLSVAALRETLHKLRVSAASPRVRYLILDAGLGFLEGVLGHRARPMASFSFSVDAADIEGELQATADGSTHATPERVRSIIALSALNTSRKQYAEAVTLAAQALPLAAEVGPAEESLAWLSMGNTIYQMEDYATARNAYVNATNLALDHGLDVLAASALTQLGHAHFCEGDHEAAIECYRTAQLYQARLGNLFGACHALLWLGEAHRARKEFKQSQEALQIALGAYESLAAPYADAAKEGKIEAEQRLSRVYRENRQAREADAAETRARELGGYGLITDKP